MSQVTAPLILRPTGGAGHRKKIGPPPVPCGAVFVDPPITGVPHARVSDPTEPHRAGRGRASAGTSVGSLAGRHRSDKNSRPFSNTAEVRRHDWRRWDRGQDRLPPERGRLGYRLTA